MLTSDKGVAEPSIFDPDDWIGSHEYFQMRDASAFENAAAIPMDEVMIQCLRSTNAIRRLYKATSDQINRKLVTIEGVKGFVTLVHWVRLKDSRLTVEKAIDHVIDVTKSVRNRAKRKNNGGWVNGWAMVGIELDTNDSDQYAFHKSKVAGGPEADTGPIDDLIKQIADADNNRVLSKSMMSDKRGLGSLVKEFGADRVVEVVQQKLIGFVIDGAPKTPPVSWAYFRPILEDEAK